MSNPFAHFTGLYRPPTPQQHQSVPPAPLPSPANPNNGVDLLNFIRGPAPQPSYMPMIPSDVYTGSRPIGTTPPPPASSTGGATKAMQLIHDLKQLPDQSNKNLGLGEVLKSLHSVYHVPNQEHPAIQEGVVKLAELSRYKRTDKADDGSVSKIISANSSFVSYSVTGGAIRVIRLADSARALLSGHTAEVKSVSMNSISPSLLVSIDVKGVAFVWKITEETGSDQKKNLSFEIIWSSSEESEHYTRVQWHPKDPSILAVATENSVEIWSMNMNAINNDEEEDVFTLVSSISDHAQPITSIMFDQSGSLIAIASEDGYVRVWSTENAKCILEIMPDSEDMSAVNFVGWVSSKYILAACKRNSFYTLFDTSSGTLVSSLRLAPPLSGESFEFSYPSISLSGSYAFVTFWAVNPSFSSNDFGVAVLQILADGNSVKFSFVNSFLTSQRVMSYDVIEHPENKGFSVYCVQPKAIQSFSLELEQCSAPKDAFLTESRLSTPEVTNRKQILQRPQVDPGRASPAVVSEISSVNDVQHETKSNDKVTSTGLDDQQESRNEPLTAKEKAEANLISRLDKLFERHHVKLLKVVEKERNDRLVAEKERLERFLSAMTATISNNIPAQVDLVIREQLQRSVLPVIQSEIQGSLNLFSSRLTSSIEQVAKSAVDNAIAQSLSPSSMEPVLRNSISKGFQKSFMENLLPAFQTATQKMFEQIDAHLVRLVKEREGKWVTQMNAHLELLQGLQTSISNLQSGLASGVIPQASKPVDIETLKSNIMKSIESGNIDVAFTEALNLGKIEIVIWICQTLDKEMWKIRSHLSGAVVLSLLQQLSFNLSDQTLLKLSWISCALVGLDRTDASISSYVPQVLNTVKLNIEQAMNELDYQQRNQASMILAIIAS